jgi:Right handed beta helix region
MAEIAVWFKRAWLSFAAVRSRHLIAAGLAALAAAAPACAEGDGNGASTTRESIGKASANLPPLLPKSRGKTFFVATSGSDSNPGTRERPWKTVQRALDRLRPGQRALVRGGTYVQDHVVERAGTRTAPITVAAYPGERAVLRAGSSGGDTYPLRITSGAAFVRIQGFVLELAKGTSSTNVYFEGSAHDVELTRNDIRFSQDQGIFVENGARRIHIIGNRIHDNGRGHESGQHQSHGIYIEGADHLVANNVIYNHPFGFGIQIYPANRGTIVVHNTVVGSGHSGIVVGGDEGVSDITIRNNVLAFNARYGVQMDSDCPTSVSIDRNVIHGNRSGAVQDGCSGVSTSGGNIGSNPRFVAPASRDYRLGPGSPAINRARADHSLRFDARGRRRPLGGGYDVGAFEGVR